MAAGLRIALITVIQWCLTILRPLVSSGRCGNSSSLQSARIRQLTFSEGVCYGSPAVSMQSRLMSKLMRSSNLRHGIAVFLLAFAVFDLAIIDMFFPQLCGEEQVALYSTDPICSTEDDVTDSLAIRNHDSQPSQDSHQSPIDEDCFCCCSHIIPSPHVNVAALNCLPPPCVTADASLPSAPPQGTFHPPRLS